MKKAEALTFFKTRRALARALGLIDNAINTWKGENIPPVHQIKLEALTAGALRADDEAWHPVPPRYSEEFFANGKRRPYGTQTKAEQ